MKQLPPYLIRESDGRKFFLKGDLYWTEYGGGGYSYDLLVNKLCFIDPSVETLLTHKSCPAFYATIFMAGDVSVAKKVCQEECDREGLCVTVEPTTYIYTGGSEEGFRVGFINYARFPNTRENILARARKLAKLLRERCGQTSFSIVTQEESLYYSTRTET